MNYLARGLTLLLTVVLAHSHVRAEDADPSGEASVKLKEWGKGIGVESLRQEGMAIVVL